MRQIDVFCPLTALVHKCYFNCTQQISGDVKGGCVSVSRQFLRLAQHLSPDAVSPPSSLYVCHLLLRLDGSHFHTSSGEDVFELIKQVILLQSEDTVGITFQKRRNTKY